MSLLEKKEFEHQVFQKESCQGFDLRHNERGQLTNICDLIRQKKSCRAYTNQPVAPETVRLLLETAKWAPSGVNHQPTKVAILGETTRVRLANRLVENFDAGIAINTERNALEHFTEWYE